MDVLITGGSGYLGSIMAERMLAEGYNVTVVDSLRFQQNSLFHLCANPNFEFVHGDVRDEGLMTRLVSKADVIVPLAAVVGAPACAQDPWMTREVNVEAVRLINRLRSQEQLVVYPTTNSGYGTQTGDVMCTEETPLEPISLYGQTKSEAEGLVLDSANAMTLRLATVFGVSPRMRLDLLVNHFTHEAVTSGYIVIFEKDFKRNYVHIRDVADCFIHCIQNSEKMIGRPYNVGLDAANLSKEELALKIQEYVPNFYLHFSEIGSDPDKRNYIVSNQRLREAGFEAKRTLDEGIPELLKAYRMMGRGAYQNV
ncbi:MAG: NAD(P)-dependent oxidoreductase [Chloroflexi bacterium]|nr:NAD(P)-dependent oxidoreductase [Chloroflexota bacterium]